MTALRRNTRTRIIHVRVSFFVSAGVLSNDDCKPERGVGGGEGLLNYKCKHGLILYSKVEEKRQHTAALNFAMYKRKSCVDTVTAT